MIEDVFNFKARNRQAVQLFMHLMPDEFVRKLRRQRVRLFGKVYVVYGIDILPLASGEVCLARSSL